MAWHRRGKKPLSEPMTVILFGLNDLTGYCVLIPNFWKKMTTVIVSYLALQKCWRTPLSKPSGHYQHLPSVFSIYVMGLVFDWVRELGGLPEIERRNIKKAKMIYDVVNSSGGFYRYPIERSHIHLILNSLNPFYGVISWAHHVKLPHDECCKTPIGNKATLEQVNGLLLSGNKPLLEPVLARMYFAIYGITRPLLVKTNAFNCILSLEFITFSSNVSNSLLFHQIPLRCIPGVQLMTRYQSDKPLYEALGSKLNDVIRSHWLKGLHAVDAPLIHPFCV